MSDLLDRAWFTPLLNRIAEIAGVPAALAIGEHKACQKIHIPNHVDDDHWLVKLVGRTAAEALCEHYGSQNLTIPPVLVGSKRRRAKAIAEMNRRGYSLNEIAATLGIARSTVIDHRAKLKDEDQGSLF